MNSMKEFNIKQWPKDLFHVMLIMSYKVTNALMETVNEAMVCTIMRFAFHSGRVGGAAFGDAGDEGPVYGGGCVPATGAQAATGTGQQDVSHLAVSPSQG